MPVPKNIRKGLRQPYLPDTGFRLRSFEHKPRCRFGFHDPREHKDDVFLSERVNRTLIDTRQFLVDNDMGIVFCDVRIGNVNTIPCQPCDLAHAPQSSYPEPV